MTLLIPSRSSMPEFAFPEVIDNSAVSAFRKCAMNWALGYGRMLASTSGNVHLHAGKAFAHGIEVARKAFFDEGHSEAAAIKRGSEALIHTYGSAAFLDKDDNPEVKDANRMLGALFEYFVQYPLATNPVKPLQLPNGKHSIEFTFSIPLPLNHPVTGNPLLYAGRFDMLGIYNETLFAVDEKTAGQLGKQWLNNWDLDSQFSGYIYGARQYQYPCAGAIIRGVSILKNDYGHAQAIVYRSEYQLNLWYESMLHEVSRMIEYWKAHWYPSALDKSACNSYGGCTFRKPCQSPNPESWLAMDFERRYWNPLAAEPDKKPEETA
jgi:hypothetical protein